MNARKGNSCFLHFHAARLSRTVDQAGNVDEYAMDDKSIVKMRKYYGHKKDRTTRAPKENKLTTNSTIDNETRLMILSVGEGSLIDR